VNPFIGWTEAELLAQRRRIQEEIAAGGMITQSSEGDVSASVMVTSGPMIRLRMVMLALYKLNPDRYPMADIPKTRSVAIMGQGI
jgi:hypothetical protein